jgi:Tol biopolymer transport system component
MKLFLPYRSITPLAYHFFLSSIIAMQLAVFGQTQASLTSPPMADEPKLFGAGVLSVGEIFRGSFTPDGRSFYFFKKVTPEQEEYRIFVSHLKNKQWSEPVRVDLGGDHSDTYPAISKDGKRMAFASYRPVPGVEQKKPNAHLWYVDRKGDGWGTPVYMAAANTIGHYHSWVEFGSKGEIYFRRVTPDFSGRMTMVTQWDGKQYGTPVPFEPVERWVNKRDDIRINGGSPGPNGKTLFFDVTVRDPDTGRFQGSDIWVSAYKRGTWSEPQPLGANINKPSYDVFPFFSPDGKQMYFVRDFAAFYEIPLADALGSLK